MTWVLVGTVVLVVSNEGNHRKADMEARLEVAQAEQQHGNGDCLKVAYTGDWKSHKYDLRRKAEELLAQDAGGTASL